jgi:hypothetical protein
MLKTINSGMNQILRLGLLIGIQLSVVGCATPYKRVDAFSEILQPPIAASTLTKVEGGKSKEVAVILSKNTVGLSNEYVKCRASLTEHKNSIFGDALMADSFIAICDPSFHVKYSAKIIQDRFGYVNIIQDLVNVKLERYSAVLIVDLCDCLSSGSGTIEYHIFVLDNKLKLVGDVIGKAVVQPPRLDIMKDQSAAQALTVQQGRISAFQMLEKNLNNYVDNKFSSNDTSKIKPALQTPNGSDLSGNKFDDCMSTAILVKNLDIKAKAIQACKSFKD